MIDAASRFRAIPESQIHPDVAGVLEPEEQVYRQERPPCKSLLFPVVIVLSILSGTA